MEEVKGLLVQINSWVFSLFDDKSAWVYEIFIIVFLTLLASLLVRWSLDKTQRKAEKTLNIWDDALVAALRKPARWLVWLTGFSWAADIAAQNSETSLLDVVDQIQTLGGIVIVGWFLNSFIRRIENNIVDPKFLRKPVDKTTALAISKLLRISILITATLVAIQSMGYSVSGVLAFGGIGGVAVGFAAKDLLANFFGGLMIYLDRPFTVGDWIRSPDQEIEGTVEKIGWRLTCIRTFDKRPLYVPNSTFTHISVQNPSRMTNRRIFETIGVRYDDADKMRNMLSSIKTMLKEHESIDQNQIVMVNFNSFAPSSLDFFVYCLTKTTDWATYHEVKQDVLLKVIDLVAAKGAECAFPTSTLHIPEGLSINGDASNNGDTKI